MGTNVHTIPNYPKVSINALSYTTSPLELRSSLSEDGLLSTATGFLYKHKTKYYLITNYHVVSGVNPITGLLLDKYGRKPIFLVFSLICNSLPLLKWKSFSFNLYEDDERLKPNWLIHPVHGSQVDVVAIEFEFDIPDVISKPINEHSFDELKPEISDEVFILGYPYKLSGGGKLPIWKRGTIASEPEIDMNKLPLMYVDTASRPGMSGAPVICRRNGIHYLENGNMVDNSVFGVIECFLGVYSGRQTGDSEFEAQLGRVWKARVIEEIIKGKELVDNG